MRTRPTLLRAAPVALLALALPTACSPAPDNGSCTAMGGVSGIDVVVERRESPVSDLRVRWCDGSRCETTRVALRRERDGQVGGLSTGPLPVAGVEVSATYRRGGRLVETGPETVPTEPVYPNGRRCPSDGTRAELRLGPG